VSTPHFTEKELQCSHCGECGFDEDFLVSLEVLRLEYGKPMRVNSGYRCPEYNTQVSSSGARGPHTIGAIDIRVAGPNAFMLVSTAMRLGWTGLGVKQGGVWDKRFIHLDRLPIGDPGHPRPRIWSY